LVSATAALDHHFEALTTNAIDSVHFANEWDGVVAFGASSASLATDLVSRAWPVKIALKEYEDPVTVARRKFPELDWEQRSDMPTKVYLAKLHEVQVALAGGASRVRAIDTVVGEVLQGRQNMSACQGENGKGYEIFKDGKWDTSLDFAGLVLFMKSELRDTFSRSRMSRGADDDDEVPVPPPEPLQSDSFITKVCECMIKYLPKATQTPLDFNVWHKLLFADGMVYDFQKDELRCQHASDRLLRCTARGFPEWSDANDLKAMIHDFSVLVKEFFVLGGSDFDPIVDEDDERNFVESSRVKELRKQCLALWKRIIGQPGSQELRALATVLCKDNSDINDIIFVKRNDARILASVPELVGMLAYTGPKNGGKSFVNMRLMNFLGAGPWSLGKQFGGKYLSSTLRDDGEASNPTTNQFRGKKLISFK
jgi:hypothetical protein